jgi:inner membrane protein YidH
MEPASSASGGLSRERNRAAAERTLMAWIRTSLSLISFGFGIDSIVAALRPDANPVRLSAILGLSFIGLGTLAMIVASLEHRAELRRLDVSGQYDYRPRRSLALFVATGLVIIGVIAFAGLLLHANL